MITPARVGRGRPGEGLVWVLEQSREPLPPPGCVGAEARRLARASGGWASPFKAKSAPPPGAGTVVCLTNPADQQPGVKDSVSQVWFFWGALL